MKACLFSLIFLQVAATALSQQGVPVNPLIMGQSYHYTNWNDAAGSNEIPFDPQSVWPNVTESGTKLVRVGGKQYNIGIEKPQDGQEVYYISIVDDIRKNGCEPVLTLPFNLTTYISPVRADLQSVRTFPVNY